MPCDYKKYPANWKTEIRPRILARAGEVKNAAGEILTQAHCEKCKAINTKVYIRGYDNGAPYYQEDDGGHYWHGDTGEYLGEDYACFSSGKLWLVRIVLTIAHFDHDVTNNDDSNLFAWCQRCHLIHDKDQHNATARETRNKKKKQIPLF